IDFAAERLLHALDNSLGPGKHAVKIVAGVIPERQLGFMTSGVLPAVQTAREIWILLGKAAEFIDLVIGEELPRDDEAVPLVRCQFVRGKARHGFGGSQSRESKLSLLPRRV